MVHRGPLGCLSPFSIIVLDKVSFNFVLRCSYPIRNFQSGSQLKSFTWVKYLALHLGGTHSTSTGTRPPSCTRLENRLYMSPITHFKSDLFLRLMGQILKFINNLEVCNSQNTMQRQHFYLLLLKDFFRDFLVLIFGNLIFSRTKKTFWTNHRFLIYCWVFCK